MTRTSLHLLPDSPLSPRPQRSRAEIVPLMVADLIKYDAWGNESDARRSLLNRGTYSSLEIVWYCDDARQQARGEAQAAVRGSGRTIQSRDGIGSDHEAETRPGRKS